jgi:flagellar protein FliO/FliZ
MGLFDIIKLIFPLLLIIGLLFGLLLLVKKIQFKGVRIIQSNIKVVHTLMLMPKKYMSFVKINDKIIVLGVSDHNITLLKELNADELEINELNNTPGSNLSDHLRNLIKR